MIEIRRLPYVLSGHRIKVFYLDSEIDFINFGLEMGSLKVTKNIFWRSQNEKKVKHDYNFNCLLIKCKSVIKDSNLFVYKVQIICY